MRNLITILAFCLLTNLSLAQSSVIKLWPGTVPGETEVKHPPVDYTANTSGNNIHRISNITDPALMVYKPGKNANGAAVIICPGGGNKYLAVNLEGEEVAAWLAAQGYMALVLEYRVPLKTLGSFQDIQRAVRLVRSKAFEWKLKSDMIGVMGFSAGGNLAARATTGFKNRSYAPEDKIDSISCRPDFSLLIYPGSLTTSDKKLIPEVKPTEETPPMFVFVAADDPYNIPFPLGQALREAKLPFEFHVTPKGGHGYGLRRGNPAAEAWPPLAEKWLKATLGLK
ncbi:alpha/beta hydrolase fold domain-containing protein [Mucilaginibacter sp. HMF7410]|uniref:Alpha/beta hydrolase fold domain-containing protein n=2 Tax=Mucilaginibacter arboris TaxID=2682090 RepID=A0A7K1STR5_9SPHI|nr:alpha/beta hydrolase fold domain-containing protein [Mucilaginibacter arboris]